MAGGTMVVSASARRCLSACASAMNALARGHDARRHHAGGLLAFLKKAGPNEVIMVSGRGKVKVVPLFHTWMAIAFFWSAADPGAAALGDLREALRGGIGLPEGRGIGER